MEEEMRFKKVFEERKRCLMMKKRFLIEEKKIKCCPAGATLCTQIGQDLDLAMAAYSVLTTITLYASYATVKSIPLATLNSIRLQVRLWTLGAAGDNRC